MYRLVSTAALLLLIPVRQAPGQQTNAERMGVLAVTCVGERTGELDAVRLDGPERLPFLRSALIAAWTASGVTVYETDAGTDAATVRVAVEDAGVSYERAEDHQMLRTVRLDLLVAVTAADGRILVDDACRSADSDLVPKDALDTLENDSYRETVGERPPDSFLKRVLHPVIVTAATAVGVFLFFSLRSRRADDGG